MRKINILIVLLFLLYACSKKSEDIIVEKKIQISTITPSLTNEDHVSEGVMVLLQDGRILQFYRLDSGKTGDHIGNNGKIVKRISADNGNSWGVAEIVYSDEYDDRNIRGGITETGAIILFFRRYDAEIAQKVDLNYIISNDGGNTWSERKVLDFGLDHIIEVWIDNFLIIGSNNYMLPVHGVGYCEIHFFSLAGNSLIIDEPNWIWDYSGNYEFGIDEPSFTLIGGNKIIGLFRDEISRRNYFQVVSTDGGITWTQPIRTNICEPFFSPSPLIFFDAANNDVIVVGTDRRDYNGNQYKAENSKVWIYSSDSDDVFNYPENHQIIDTLNRPMPSEWNFYGYPNYTQTNDNTYLIMFTGSSYDGVNEDADLFQFTIQYQ